MNETLKIVRDLREQAFEDSAIKFLDHIKQDDLEAIVLSVDEWVCPYDEVMDKYGYSIDIIVPYYKRLKVTYMR